MKSNWIKYVFVIFIIIILVFAIYIIRRDETEKQQEEAYTASNQDSRVKEIKLGIANFDTINPILSNNKNVQNITKLIYEPLVNLTSDYKAEPCLATEWAKESDNQLTVGTFDSYVLRASYVPIMTYDYAWTHDEKLDYELLRYHQNEWRQIVDYFYKDFYVLTPMREVNDEENWTVYEYFDSGKNSGVLQAFRPKNSEESQITIKLKGVKEDSFYSINDFDDNMDIPRISGRMLKNGLTLRLPQRGSLVLEIQEVE